MFIFDEINVQKLTIKLKKKNSLKKSFINNQGKNKLEMHNQAVMCINMPNIL